MVFQMLAAKASCKLTHVRVDIHNVYALTLVCLLGIRSKVKRVSDACPWSKYKSSPNYRGTWRQFKIYLLINYSKVIVI